jgi:hypothetical protein
MATTKQTSMLKRTARLAALPKMNPSFVASWQGISFYRVE